MWTDFNKDFIIFKLATMYLAFIKQQQNQTLSVEKTNLELKRKRIILTNNTLNIFDLRSLSKSKRINIFKKRCIYFIIFFQLDKLS